MLIYYNRFVSNGIELELQFNVNYLKINNTDRLLVFNFVLIKAENRLIVSAMK